MNFYSILYIIHPYSATALENNISLKPTFFSAIINDKIIKHLYSKNKYKGLSVLFTLSDHLLGCFFSLYI